MAFERIDGRGPYELRPVTITKGYINTAPGSALIELGNTKVICTVSLEDRVPAFLVGSGKGWLTAEYGMLPGSSSKRIKRETATGRVNGRNKEIQRMIGRTLRTILDFRDIGERTIYIDCDVIQADGGTRTASITGSYVALVEAINRFIKDGTLNNNPLLDAVAAISVGVVEGKVLLDLCYAEDVRAETDMNVAMTGNGGIVEVQGSAEGRPFSRCAAEQMLDVSDRGIKTLLTLQKEVLESGKFLPEK